MLEWSKESMERYCRSGACRQWLWPVLVMLLVPATAWAQQIEGQVVDAAGVPLPGVNVVLPEVERGAVTDAEGRYVVAQLSVGTYAVAFRFVGYETVQDTVTLAFGETVTLDATLVPATLDVDEIIVRGAGQPTARLNKASLAVSTLDARALDAVRGQTLGETLEALPGVTTLSTGPSIAKPVVRGLHSQRVVVLNAGVPQEGQQWGGEHAPEIDPFAPAQIEVVKGAAGVEYGVGAIGGAIRVKPRDLPAAPGVGGEISFNAFSNNRQGAGSILIEGGSSALPGVGWRLQGSVRKAGDAHAPEHVIGNSAFEEFDGTVAVGYHRDRLGLDAYFSHFGTELGLFSGAHIGNADDLRRAIERGEPAVDYDFSYDIDAPKQTVQHDLLTLRAHYQLPSDDWLEVQYGFQNNQRKEFDAHRRFGDPLDEPAFALTLRTQTLEAKLRTRPRGRFFGVAGVSGMNQANRNTESGYLIPNFRAITGGAFTRGTWISGPWTLEAGTRYDVRWMEAFPRENLSSGDFVQRTHTYQSLSGVVGAIWQFASTWSLAANVGTAWRPPGVNELYNFGVHHGTAQFEIGDPDLTGERSVNLDMTLRHASTRASAEVSVYANRIQDYIYLFPTLDETITIRGAFPTFEYQQDDAILRGIDGQVRYALTDWGTVQAVGSVVRGTNRTTDEPLIAMPSDRLTLSGILALPRWGVLGPSDLEVGGTFIREQTRVPENAEYAPPPDGYALLGVGVRTEVQWGSVPLSLSLEVDNLLDTSYRDYLSRFRYFIDDPGRNVVLRLRAPLGTLTR